MIQTTNVLSRIINEIILLLVLVCEQHCHNRQLMCSRKAFTLDKITNLNKCNQENNTSCPPMSVNTPVCFVLNQGVDKKRAIYWNLPMLRRNLTFKWRILLADGGFNSLFSVQSLWLSMQHTLSYGNNIVLSVIEWQKLLFEVLNNMHI